MSVILRVNGAGKAYDESRQILEYGFDNFSSVIYKRNSTKKTFYDIMGLSCLGDAAAFQLNAWKRHPYSDCYVALTLPDTVSSSDLKYKVTQENGAARSVSYQYEGIEVGSSRGSFYPINAPARSMFRVQRQSEKIQKRRRAIRHRVSRSRVWMMCLRRPRRCFVWDMRR